MEVFHSLFFPHFLYMLPASHRRGQGSKPGHLFFIYGGQSGTLTGFSAGIEIVCYFRPVALLLTTSRNIETESLY